MLSVLFYYDPINYSCQVSIQNNHIYSSGIGHTFLTIVSSYSSNCGEKWLIPLGKTSTQPTHVSGGDYIWQKLKISWRGHLKPRFQCTLSTLLLQLGEGYTIKKNWNEWTPAKSKDIYVPGNELNFFFEKNQNWLAFGHLKWNNLQISEKFSRKTGILFYSSHNYTKST